MLAGELIWPVTSDITIISKKYRGINKLQECKFKGSGFTVQGYCSKTLDFRNLPTSEI